MSEAEAREFWAQDLGFGPGHSLRPADVERAIEAAGLQLLRRVDFGGEWGEYHQERNGTPGRRLLHASRLLRDPRRYVEQFGEENYRVMLTDCLWHVYGMIGKLHGVAFLVRKSSMARDLLSR